MRTLIRCFPLFILFSLSAAAQQIILSGIVTDRDGTPVSEAVVTLITPTDSGTQSDTTDDNGSFSVLYDPTSVLTHTTYQRAPFVRMNRHTIAIGPDAFDKPFSVTLYSLAGKPVVSAYYPGDAPVAAMTLNNLSKGVYILHAGNESQSFHYQLIYGNGNSLYTVRFRAGHASQTRAAAFLALLIEHPDYVPVHHPVTSDPEHLHIILDRTDPSEELTTWLDDHPAIADNIIWHSTSDSAYPDWPTSMKNDLTAAYNAFRWKETSGLPDTPAIDQHTLYNDGDIHSILYSRATAWTYYIHYLAQSLALEIKGIVPWSITDYTDEDLNYLLNSRSLFEWASGPRRYSLINYHNYADLVVHGPVTPGDPGRIAAFLDTNNCIGGTQRETIANVLDWCRGNLSHFFGGYDTTNMIKHWQYSGFPPAERIITGTVYHDQPDLGIMHWTSGCWGTCAFLRIVLRTVNIPVRLVRVAGHALPWFLSEHAYLSHGDDLYNQHVHVTPPYPAEELLISEETFREWFDGKTEAEQQKFIGRRTYELAVEYVSDLLLEKYCQDLQAGTDHQNSLVYESLSRFFTLQELEADGLWERIEGKADSSGGCIGE